MINIVELYGLVAPCRYLNCYSPYLDSLNDDVLELRATLLHRMHVYYEILELIYDSINE